jgi:hypothetical protein
MMALRTGAVLTISSPFSRVVPIFYTIAVEPGRFSPE